MLAAQRQPALHYASIGSGQIVSQLATDQQTYRDLLAYADRSGDSGLAKKLRAQGEPPYDDVFADALLLQHYDDLIPDYDARLSDAGVGPLGMLGSEYAFVDKVNVIAGLMDMFAVMCPQLQGIDFRTDVPSLAVPV